MRSGWRGRPPIPKQRQRRAVQAALVALHGCLVPSGGTGLTVRGAVAVNSMANYGDFLRLRDRKTITYDERLDPFFPERRARLYYVSFEDQRIETEKARATADQQPELVAAEIRVKIAEKDKQAAQLKGEGEKLMLIEIATGQKNQVSVLGQDKVLQLAVLDKILKAAVENPAIVKIPHILVAGEGSSLEGAAAILGASNIVTGFSQNTKTGKSTQGQSPGN